MSGRLIVIYGVNNLGKTAQARLLVEKLNALGKNTSYFKYPLYELEPSGPLLNDYLRKGNPFGLSNREAQIIYILNRTQYDLTLRKRLEQGEWIVAEDYTGTGIAWGMGGGVAREFTESMSRHLLQEDLALLFTGARFLQSRETGHLHEGDDDLVSRVARAHEELAADYGWSLIAANHSIEEVAREVWKIVSDKFNL